jgi:hypothetical protein
MQNGWGPWTLPPDEGIEPLTQENIWLLNACDDAPRPKLKRHAIRSRECRSGAHDRACSTTPCTCSCHQLQPRPNKPKRKTSATAMKLIWAVEARGGSIRVDGPKVVITPRSAAIPLQEQLIAHKKDIMVLLRERNGSLPFQPGAVADAGAGGDASRAGLAGDRSTRPEKTPPQVSLTREGAEFEPRRRSCTQT